MFIVVFFYDKWIYSRSWEDHLEHVGLALKTIQENQMFVKFSKCRFRVKQVDYLGHIILGDVVAVDQSKIQAMVSWPEPSKRV